MSNKAQMAERLLMRVVGLVLAPLLCFSSEVVFQAPVSLGPADWGVTMFASFTNDAFAVQVGSVSVQIICVSNPATSYLQNMMLTANGGQNFSRAYVVNDTIGAQSGITSNLIHANADSTTVHSFGTVAERPHSGNSSEAWTHFLSNSSTFFVLEENASAIRVITNDTQISFRGLPRSTHCGKFACPIRLQGSGSVTFGDGTQVNHCIQHIALVLLY
jgi:hypothetical protein